MKKYIVGFIVIVLSSPASASLYKEFITNADGGKITLLKRIPCQDDLIVESTPRDKRSKIFKTTSRTKQGKLILTGCGMEDPPFLKIIWKEFGYDTFTYGLNEIRSTNPNDPRNKEPLPLTLSVKPDWNTPRKWQAPQLPESTSWPGEALDPLYDRSNRSMQPQRDMTYESNPTTQRGQ